MPERPSLTEPSDRKREALWKRRISMEHAFERARMTRGYEIGDRLSHSRLPETLLRMVGLWDRGVDNALRPALTRQTFAFANLPTHLDGFRILQVSDMHFNSAVPEFAGVVRDTLASVEADLCVMTGDFRFAHTGSWDHVYRDLETVLSGVRARHGVTAVLGNHDLSVFVGPFRAMGIRVLTNENTHLAHPGGGIWVAGVDDSHRYRCADLALAVQGIPEEAFTLLLAHTPELALDAPRHGVDLYLCGHTHWGQIQFPLVGALLYNARCPRRYCEGRWSVKNMQGYTTAGIGTTDLPVRYNCPPEACLIELRRG